MIDINKDYVSEIGTCTPDEQELSLISTFTRKPIPAEKLYTFSLILCDNEVDRDCERFSTDALHSLAELFVGKTGIYDHSMSSKDQTARIFSTQVVTDESKTTSAGEPYTYVRAKAYMLRNEKNAALIEEIDGGIKKEPSIGCAVSEKLCSVCGASLTQSGCEHIRGKIYGGKTCHTVLSKASDAYEWSFVAVPAQRAAGVIKSFNTFSAKETEKIVKTLSQGDSVTLSGKALEQVKEHITKLSNLAEYGRQFRDELLLEIIRSGALCLPEMKGESLSDICSALTLEQLLDLREAFRSHTSKSACSSLQLQPQSVATEGTNNQFKI